MRRLILVCKLTLLSLYVSANIAKLLVHIVSKFSLSMNVLKVVDFTSLNENMSLFCHVFFVTLLVRQTYLCTQPPFLHSFSVIMGRVITTR